MEAFRYQQVAIFEGKTGVVVAEHECVHKRVNQLSDTIEIPANKLPDPGHIWIIANYLCTISVDEILRAPYQEMLFTDFFSRRDYNPRCQDNYQTLLRSLQAIEFDLTGYLPVKQSLSNQIQAAAQHTERPPAALSAVTRDNERGDI